MTQTNGSTPTRAPRGFAALSIERRREIARMGGRHAHKVGRAHQFTTEEARAAGRKGAASRAANRAQQ